MKTATCYCLDVLRHVRSVDGRLCACPRCRTTWKLTDGRWIRTGHLNTNGRPAPRRRLHLVA